MPQPPDQKSGTGITAETSEALCFLGAEGITGLFARGECASDQKSLE